MIWLDRNQNHLLLCQNDVVMYFVERVNQGECLASWLNWLTEPLLCVLVCDHGDFSPDWKGVYWTLLEAFWTGPPSCAVHSMLCHHFVNNILDYDIFSNVMNQYLFRNQLHFLPLYCDKGCVKSAVWYGTVPYRSHSENVAQVHLFFL